MTNKTRSAILGSIKKWEDILNNEGTDEGTDNCPLCQLFFKYDCDGCPVSEKVNDELCKNTPYERWFVIISEIHNDKFTLANAKEISNDAEKAVKDEIEFLKEVLVNYDKDKE